MNGRAHAVAKRRIAGPRGREGVRCRDRNAKLLEVPAGSASLNIERISYLASGKVIEFTRSVYRGDTYDFVAELSVT